jgi:hypothetical protein
MLADWDAAERSIASAVEALRSGALPPSVLVATDPTTTVHVRGPFMLTCVLPVPVVPLQLETLQVIS